jgi:molybdopterin-guanine dinucleotide biosynthesis protein A
LIITVAIFAGGQSRRMGTDKAALEVEGRTLLARTAEVALAANLPVLVVGRAQPAGWPFQTVVFAEDTQPGLGPLGGLATALGQSETTAVLALACDLPLLTPDAVRWLGTQTGKGNEHGLIVVNAGNWEPLFSVYQPACLPLLEARLAEGKRSLHGLIEAGQFAFRDAPAWAAAQLININTPEQWQALQENVNE